MTVCIPKEKKISYFKKLFQYDCVVQFHGFN